MTSLVLLPVAAALASAGTSPAASAAAGPAPVRHLAYQGITEYRLGNGLKLLLIPDASQPTVTVNLTIFAGSAAEDYGETGAAHLLEHLCFKGSPDFGNVPGALNEHGATWNGTTWTDRTNYFETMPASAENLDFGVHFEAARLMRSAIRQENLDSEMSVVRNEFERGENDPSAVLSERMVSTAYLFHGYQHSTIGARSDIEGVPIERLQGFYRKWYRPDNALLIIAGRFEEKQALDSVARHFGTLENPRTPLVRLHTVEPAQDGERAVTLRRVGEVGAVGAVYHTPAASHADAAAVELIGEVLAAAPSGRLYKALVETKKAVSVEAYPFQWKDPSVLQVMAKVRKDGSLAGVRDEMLAVVEALGKEGASSEEVERARNTVLKQKTLLFARSERLAVEMSEWAAMGDWRLFFVYKDRIAAVTAADVKRVAAAYLQTNNRTIGTYVPTSAPERIEIPASGDLAPAIALLSTAEGDQLAAETLDLDPTKLEARTRRVSVAGSGVQLALLSKKTRGGVVTGALTLFLGNPRDLTGKEDVNAYVAEMLRRGTVKHTRSAIKDALDKLQAEVRISGSSNQTDVTFTTTHDNLEGVTGLILEMLKTPSFDAKEFDLLRQEKLAELEQASREPQALASIALQHHLYPKGHIQHVPTVPEQLSFLNALTVAALQGFHQEFYGAGKGFAAVVGDFDAAAYEKTVAAGLGGWSSPRPAERIAASFPGATMALVKAIETPDKENALTMAGVTFAMRRDQPEYPSLLIANWLTGGEPLNARLSVRLRQKDGLCYGAGSTANADIVGDAGFFTFYAISAPQNAERVEQGFREELQRAMKDGFTAEEVTRSRGAWLERYDTQLARDSFLAREMMAHMMQGKTFTEIADLKARVQAVGVPEVNAVTRRFFNPQAMALFRAGDFAKAQGSEAPTEISVMPKK